NHRIEIEAPGFQKNVFTNVTVSAGTNTINATLALGAVSETVVVAGAPPPSLPGSAKPVGGPGTGLGALGGAIGASTSRGRVRALEAMGRAEAAAKGQELGDLFEYKLKERVTIHKRSEEHTSELQSPDHLVCRLLLEKK